MKPKDSKDSEDKKKAYAGAGGGETDRNERGEARLREVDPTAPERLMAALGDVAPDLVRYIIEFPFGDVYSRPGLELRERMIVTVTALAVQGNAPAQLKVHLRNAMHVGLSREEIIEILLQVAVYAGFPASMNAMMTLKEVLEEMKE